MDEKQLPLLCRDEALTLLKQLPRHPRPLQALHTLKANVHALGLMDVAHEVHAWEEKLLAGASPLDVPVAGWARALRLSRVEGQTEFFAHLARRAGKKLNLTWEGPFLPHFHSVFLHLLRNTLAHGGRAELRFDVRVSFTAGEWQVRVSDDGQGFGQKKKAGADLWSGRGQGLAHVKEQVEAWGGRMSWESSPAGCTFLLQFPTGNSQAA